MTDNDYQFYGAYGKKLTALETNVKNEIEGIIAEYAAGSAENPVEHVLSRIKSAGSMQEKLTRKGYSVDVVTALKSMGDTIGIRCVTHFVGDVYELEKRILARKCWQVVEEKDYIASPKENGYRSLHMILNVPFDDEEVTSIKVEIQLRTIAMDCWASLEHEMRYKKSIENTDLIARELKRCAGEMASTDLSMQTIKEMIRGEF